MEISSNCIKVMHKKPVSDPLTALQFFAMPEFTKVAILSSEVKRRLKTTNTKISQEEIKKILVRIIDDIASMGHTKDWDKRS